MSSNGITVLVVEDEASVLAIIGLTLERAGYRVLATTSAQSAIALAIEHADSINVLILDVIMPELSGPQVHELLQLHLRNPDIPTIYTSGYPEAFCGPDQEVLPKPFAPRELLNSVKRALAQPPGHAPDFEHKRFVAPRRQAG